MIRIARLQVDTLDANIIRRRPGRWAIFRSDLRQASHVVGPRMARWRDATGHVCGDFAYTRRMVPSACMAHGIGAPPRSSM